MNLTTVFATAGLFEARHNEEFARFAELFAKFGERLHADVSRVADFNFANRIGAETLFRFVDVPLRQIRPTFVRENLFPKGRFALERGFVGRLVVEAETVEIIG